MRLCLLGSPDVKVVLILNWTKLPYGRVKGTVGLFQETSMASHFGGSMQYVLSTLSVVVFLLSIIDYDTNGMGFFCFRQSLRTKATLRLIST